MPSSSIRPSGISRRRESHLPAPTLGVIDNRAFQGEQRYRFMADTMSQIIWTATPDGNLDYYNQRWYDYTGLTLEETKDWGWKPVLHPDDLQNCVDRWTHAFTTGEDYEVEYRFKRAADGAYRWHLGRAVPVRNDVGEILQWVGTCTDIDDSKRAEEALNQAHATLLQSEKQYRLLAESMPQIVWIAKPGSDVSYYNHHWYEYTGLNPEKTEDESWRAVLHPEDLLGCQKIQAKGMAAGEAFEFEYRLRRADGQWRWHLGRIVPQRDESGAIVQWVGTGTDIDDFKRAGDALRQANETLELRVEERTEELRESMRFAETIAENSTSIIFVFDLDTMTNVYSNRTVSEFLGYTAQQVQEMGSDLLPMMLHPDDLLRVLAHFAQFAGKADGEVVEMEYRALNSGGEWRWIWNRETVFKRHSDGAPCQIMGTAQDITERKRQEAALEEDRALLAAIVSIQNEVIGAELDLSAVMELVALRAQELTHAAGAVIEIAEGDELVYRAVCGTMADHLGTRIPIGSSLSGQSLTTNSILVCEDTLHDPRVHAALCAALQIRSMIVVPLHRDQRTIGVLKVLSPLPNAFTERESQTLQLMAGLVTTAISRAAQFASEQALLAERAAALTKLAESEAQFRSAVDAMQEGFVVQDQDSNILVCNDLAEEILGSSHLVGQNVTQPQWRVIYEDGSACPRAAQPSQIALRTGQPQPAQVLGCAYPDGKVVWLSLSAAPLFHHGEETPYAVVTTFSDITERLQTQERFRVLFECSSDAHMLLDDSGIIDCNHAAVALLGCADKSQLLATHPGILSPEYQPDGRRSDEKCFEMDAIAYKTGFHRFEWQHQKRDGELFPVEVTLTPVALNGKSVLLVVLHDLTQRKQAEDALRKAEENYRSIFENAIEGIFQTSPEGRLLSANPAMARLFGYKTPEELAATITNVAGQAYYHAADRARFLELIRRDGSVTAFEAPFRRRDGSMIWASMNARAVRGPQGEALYFEGTLHDITERRLAEQNLKDYQIVLEFQKQELEKANVQLEALATSDGLTGLKNHRAFQERLTDEFARAARYQMPLSALMMDVDKFKEYNDEFGHPAGDEVLRQVGRLLQETMRESDLVARYGGEEFAAVLPLTDGAGAQILAERCRIIIAEAYWDKRPITVSFGIATLTPDIGDAHTLISRADQALYAAKAGGRNRVSFAHTLPAQTAQETQEIVYLA